jgi:hypothetical protein
VLRNTTVLFLGRCTLFLTSMQWQDVNKISYSYCYGVVSHMASLELRPFLVCCLSPSELQLFLIHPPELSGKYQQRHLVAKQEKLGGKWPWILPMKYLFSYAYGFLTCRKILTAWGLWRKLCYWFSPPFKIHPWLGLNPWTLGPVASTLTTRPLSMTHILVKLEK